MSFKIKTVLAVTACAAICSGKILAQDKEPGSGPNPYSDCGIGAALFPNSDVGAAISNVIWDLGTTAVISATASPETCEGSDAQAATFILETYDQLVEETAVGEGKHISTLLSIVNSDDQIISELRSSIADLVASEEYTTLTQLEKSNAYYGALKSAMRKI